MADETTPPPATPIPVEPGKAWYDSKTLWINGLLIAAGLAEWYAGQTELGVTITLPAIINVVLRLITKSALTTSNK